MESRNGPSPETYLNYATLAGVFPTVKMIPDTGFIYVRLVSVILAIAGWQKKQLFSDYLTE
ncbi:hypothetical protein [Enterococcus sp.]|uniref:hypothetical protein n=1 Tax=Enterococcus sp. TaxID=35783 RepID=UPI002913D9A3|nr:hypothetical protein [Enterococcus sp.]MDU5333266.1 hypothetical protein [Enterococcus sp.]